MKWIDAPGDGDDDSSTGVSRRTGDANAIEQRSDLYASWAEISDFRGFTQNRFFPGQRQGPNGGIAADDWVSFIAKASAPDDIAAIAIRKARGKGFAYIPQIYGKAVDGTNERALHFTGRVRRSDLPRLRAQSGIERWELGLPVATPDSGHPNDKGRGSPDRNGNASTRPKNVIAVIDYGCALLNSCFRHADGKHTRIHHFWDQGVVRGKGWLTCSGFGYGRVLDSTHIDSLLNARRLAAAKGAGTDETETYRDLGLLHLRADHKLPIRNTAHGTHVLDVVGGRRNPWTQEEDAASDASLVFVELPFRTAADGSGGSLSVHLLDGLREILRVSDANAKIMVSLSQGTHAGPHDGSSLIEEAMDELLRLRSKNFCIVIGAGNARHSQAHVSTELKPRETIEVALEVPSGDRTDTFVECWYPCVSKGTRSKLTVSVLAPGQTEADDVDASAGQSKALVGDAAAGEQVPVNKSKPKCVAALIHRESTANGQDAMALLALGPADPAALARCACAPAGTWRLRLRNAGTSPVPFDCYVERDEPVRPPRMTYPKFLSQQGSRGGARLLGPTEEGTLNTLATGRHTLVVGACYRNTGGSSPYTSAGPVRGGPRAGIATPQVLAAADESTQFPGVRAAGVRSGSTFRMNGTSVAAPTLARLLYVAMADKDVGRNDWDRLVDDLAKKKGAAAG